MRYEIDNKNAIRVFNDGEDFPVAFQPDWPDTTPWASADEAKQWAELLIESMENPESEYLPGISPDEPKRLRPEPVEIEPETGLPVKETQSTEAEK